jgi:hypothetical protein
MFCTLFVSAKCDTLEKEVEKINYSKRKRADRQASNKLKKNNNVTYCKL